MRIALTAPALAVALVLGTSACGAGTPSISCPAGTVVEYDDDGAECEPDADGDGVDDEESDDSDSHKDKKKNKKSSKQSKPKANKPAKKK